MIAYKVVLLTDIENVLEACTIDIMYGTSKLSLCGEMVRTFVRATNHAYHDYPFDDCLELGLTLVPPELRYILRYLYETLKGEIEWTGNP